MYDTLSLFKTGLFLSHQVIDEVLSNYISKKSTHGLANTEFSRRVAMERELDKNHEQFGMQTMTFDESSNFILYPTLLGIKVLNLKTNQCVRVIGLCIVIFFSGISLYVLTIIPCYCRNFVG